MSDEFPNGQYKLTVENRITKVETNLYEIMTNHLPHLEDSIKGLRGTLDKILWLAITGVVGVVVDLILRLLS